MRQRSGGRDRDGGDARGDGLRRGLGRTIVGDNRGDHGEHGTEKGNEILHLDDWEVW